MENIKLLIVDDVEDNRLVLRAICRKLDGFEIFEAVDGQDAVEKCEALRPHIVLMDIMMPRLDGFQASKLIKERYPDTIIMAVTAVIDPKMEENMAAIGVAAYLRKPIDKDLIRLKLQSYAGALLTGGRENKPLNNTTAINPFSNEIRNFKTVFDIRSIEGIMDFGVWLLVRFECTNTTVCTNVNMIIELLYELLYIEIKNDAIVTITIEESFDEVFIHATLPKKAQIDQKIEHLIRGFGDSCSINDTMIAFRVAISTAKNSESKGCTPPEVRVITKKQEQSAPQSKPIEKVKDTRSIGAEEQQILRESFVHKITAKEYVESIDSDAFGEVSDLREAAVEWTSWLHTLKEEGTEENFRHFANEVLEVYYNAISALYEFSGLAYAIISLSSLIKANAGVLVQDDAKRANTLQFLEYFKNDLSSWVEHVFELQDTQDIHYLDGSFFSSCMQIESIMTGIEVDLGEEGEIEFF